MTAPPGSKLTDVEPDTQAAAEDEEQSDASQRKGYLGGSDLPAILGLSRPYADARTVWLDKVGEPAPEEGGTTDAEWGRLLEGPIRQMYERQTGRQVVAEKGLRRHPELPWAGVHLDGAILAPGELPGVYEGKAPRMRVLREMLDGMRARDCIQIQWGLFVTGWDWGSLAAGHRDADPPVLIVDVERHRSLISSLGELADEFWHMHVVGRVPPDPQAWALRGAKLNVPAAAADSAGQVMMVRDDPITVAVAESYRRTWDLSRAASKMLEDRKRDVAAHMAALDCDALSTPVGRFYHRERAGQVRLDQDALRRLRPLDGVKVSMLLTDLLARVDAGEREPVLTILKGALAGERDLALDLEAITRQGKPFRPLRYYPAKDG